MNTRDSRFFCFLCRGQLNDLKFQGRVSWVLMEVNCLVFNPLNPNISMRILHAFLHTFYNGDEEENLLNNQDLYYLLITSFFFLQPLCFIEQCYNQEKLNIGHS